MTTSGSSLGAFERRWKTLSAELATSVPSQIVEETAKIYKGVIKSQINAVAPSGKLRNVGRNGARIGVSYKLLGGDRAVVFATGPLHLIERKTGPHDIPRTLSSRRLRTAAGRLSRKRESTGRVLSGRKVLKINGNLVMGPVHHPGTKAGKHPFERGAIAAESAAFAASGIVFNRSLESLFR